jgi:CubicO group peptidase (beta-lactamase class C family)
MGKIVERVVGKSLDNYLSEVLWKPMGMNSTMFRPDPTYKDLCVPTEIDNYWRMRPIQGTVHDENCDLLGGVSGHAGVFSTVQDITKYMMMLLSGGVYKAERYLSTEVIKQFISRFNNKSSRALGWDTNLKHTGVGGKGFSETSFGHTGFTGTSIWADYTGKFAIIFFTNRVYPSRNKVGFKEFRIRLYEAISSLLTSK